MALTLVALRSEDSSRPKQQTTAERTPQTDSAPIPIQDPTPGIAPMVVDAAPEKRRPADSRFKPAPGRARAYQTPQTRQTQPDGPDDDFEGLLSEAEITTDFFSLVEGGRLAQIEGGQIVRVELPRSALISFGLPMNMERAEERITADVVIGNDGLAHAIRFVR
jgi:hypothetical protein